MTTDGAELKAKQLEEENKLLLQQLVQVQEELKYYFDLSKQNNSDKALMPKKIPFSFIELLPKRLSRFLGVSLKRQAKIIRASGLFNEKWYQQQYPDISQGGVDPIDHYLRYGAAEGRNPSPDFNTNWYLSTYPDVAGNRVNPLLHYIKFGVYEGRKTQRVIGKDKAAIKNEQQIKAFNEQAELVSALRSELEQANQAREAQTRIQSEQAELVNVLRSELEQANQAKEAQSHLVEEIQQQNDEHNRVREEQAKLVAQLRQELSSARQTASLSVKLQMLREADLKDLQGRYKDSLSKQEEQHQLLTKLAERLGVVSNYFHQLADTDEKPLSVGVIKSKAAKKTTSAPAERRSQVKVEGGV